MLYTQPLPLELGPTREAIDNRDPTFYSSDLCPPCCNIAVTVLKIPLRTFSDSCSVLEISDSFFFERLKVLWWETLVLEPHVTHAARQVESLGFVGCEVLTAGTMENMVF